VGSCVGVQGAGCWCVGMGVGGGLMVGADHTYTDQSSEGLWRISTEHMMGVQWVQLKHDQQNL
jgi:hypothetical protein